VGFVVGKVVLGQVLLRVLRFPPSHSNICPFLYPFIYHERFAIDGVAKRNTRKQTQNKKCHIGLKFLPNADRILGSHTKQMHNYHYTNWPSQLSKINPKHRIRLKKGQLYVINRLTNQTYAWIHVRHTFR